MKGTPQNGRKYLTMGQLTRLMSKIYKQLMQLNSKESKQSNQKKVEDLNRHFSKEEMQMVNKYMKRCSALLIIREMQIKTIRRYHFMLVRMAIIIKIYR